MTFFTVMKETYLADEIIPLVDHSFKMKEDLYQMRMRIAPILM